MCSLHGAQPNLILSKLVIPAVTLRNAGMGPDPNVIFASRDPAQLTPASSSSSDGCDGCIRLTVGAGEAGNNPTGKGWLGQCAHLTTVLVNVFTNLGEMNICSQYENMRQPSYPMNSGQPRACSGMHAQISPWHGCLSRLPLKLPPYHIRYSANRMGISALKL